VGEGNCKRVKRNMYPKTIVINSFWVTEWALLPKEFFFERREKNLYFYSFPGYFSLFFELFNLCKFF
jgi:hypothetical protein